MFSELLPVFGSPERGDQLAAHCSDNASGCAYVQHFSVYTQPEQLLCAGLSRCVPFDERERNQQIQTYIYAAWPDPNIFPPGWADVLPLSHEVSEWMNDPFIHNFVPPWQFPGIPGSCQGNLETGDPMEVVPNPDFPVTIGGFTYHPQTEAILPWFTRESPSSAIGGAYSYPDTTKLTTPAQSCQ